MYCVVFFLLFFHWIPSHYRLCQTHTVLSVFSSAACVRTHYTVHATIIFFVFFAMYHSVLRASVSRSNVPLADLLVVAVAVAVAVEDTAAERLWKTIPWNGSAERHCYGPPPPTSLPPPPPPPPTRRRQWTTVRPRYIRVFFFI